MNTVQLIGRLTKDIDLKFTASGTAVGNFTLAVNRSFTNQQGEREADFIRCVIWRKSAENLANFTHKGSLIGVVGRIQTRSYDDNNGQRQYITEVVVEDFHLLEKKEDSQAGQQTNQGGQPYNQNYGNQQYNQNRQQQPQQGQQYQYASQAQQGEMLNRYNQPQQDLYMNEGRQVDINQDDLPF